LLSRSLTLADYLPYVAEAYIYRYTNVAFMALLVWDHVITLNLEIERIWILNWWPSKLLFLFNRYIVPLMLSFNVFYPAVYNLSQEVCEFVPKWATWPTLLSLATVQLLLILRVRDIWNRSQAVTIFLGVVFIICTISYLSISISVLTKTTVGTAGDILPGCVFDSPSYIWTSWIPPTVFESVVVVLALYRVIKCRQKYQQIMQHSETPYILYLVARDSLLYFIIMFSALLANLLLSRYQSGYFSAILITPSSVIACIAASRMTLHFRESKRRRNHIEVELTMQDFGFSTVEDDEL